MQMERGCYNEMMSILTTTHCLGLVFIKRSPGGSELLFCFVFSQWILGGTKIDLISVSAASACIVDLYDDSSREKKKNPSIYLMY